MRVEGGWGTRFSALSLAFAHSVSLSNTHTRARALSLSLSLSLPLVCVYVSVCLAHSHWISLFLFHSLPLSLSLALQFTRPLCRTDSTTSQDILPQVHWLILGSKSPGRLLSKHPIDVTLWLSGAVDLGEMFWLAVGSVRCSEHALCSQCMNRKL